MDPSEKMSVEGLMDLLSESEGTSSSNGTTDGSVLSTRIRTVYKVLVESKVEMDKDSPVVKKATQILLNLIPLPLGPGCTTSEDLRTAALITVACTKIGSMEGATTCARLLSKMMKSTTEGEGKEEVLRIIGSEMGIQLERMGRMGQRSMFYYEVLRKSILGQMEIKEEVFEEVVMPLITKLLTGESRSCGEVLAKFGKLEWLDKKGFLEVGLKSRGGFLVEVLLCIESNAFEMDEGRFTLLCRRIVDLEQTEFDEMIKSVFEYLASWEERRKYEALGVLVDVLDFVLKICPEPVKEELTRCLKSMDLWHVRILVCWELFGEPQGEIIDKTESTLPLELYLCYKNKNNSPSIENESSLIPRILSLKDNLTYKFCVLTMDQALQNPQLTNFEMKLEEIKGNVKALMEEHGGDSCSGPRIRRVLGLRSLTQTTPHLN